MVGNKILSGNYINIEYCDIEQAADRTNNCIESSYKSTLIKNPMRIFENKNGGNLQLQFIEKLT